MKRLGLGFAAGAFALGLMVGFGQGASADDQAGVAAGNAVPGAQSETTGSSVFGTLTDHAYIGITSTLHGPELNALDSPLQLDHNGNFSGKNSPLWFDSDSIVGYKVTKDIVVGADVPFYLAVTEGYGFIVGDVGARVKALTLYRNGGLLINGSMYLQAPTSTYSKAMDMWMGLKFTPNVIYTFPRSRFTVGLLTEEKEYFHEKDKSFKLWGAPFVQYQVAPKLSAQLLYEMEAHHNPPTNPNFYDFDGYQNDLQPGLVWFVSPQLTVNPFVQVFTGRPALDHAALGLFINATVL
jgi:hypothetical protein